MNAREKWVAALLGILMFLGLAFFIWTSLQSPPVAPMDDFYAEDEDDYDVNMDSGTLDSLFSAEPTSTATTKTPLK